jgi:hypothetical protein
VKTIPKTLTCALFVALFLIASVTVSWTAVSYRGGAFSYPGIDARTAAMGGTGVIGSYGPTALFWNPANLFQVERLDVALGYTDLYGLGLIRYNFAGAAFKHIRSRHTLAGGELTQTEQQAERIALGILINNLGLDMGTYSYDEIEATFGIACVPTGQVLFGASLRLLGASADLDDYSTSGVAADVGITVLRFSPLRFALAWKNFYSSVNWKGNPKEKLPFLPSVGISYTPHHSLTLLSSAILSTDGGTTREWAVGAEWYPMGKPLALRAGLTQKQPEDFSRSVASFGAGLGIGRFFLDYAYVLDDEALGDTHWFSGRYRY